MKSKTISRISLEMYRSVTGLILPEINSFRTLPVISSYLRSQTNKRLPSRRRFISKKKRINLSARRRRLNSLARRSKRRRYKSILKLSSFRRICR